MQRAIQDHNIKSQGHLKDTRLEIMFLALSGLLENHE